MPSQKELRWSQLKVGILALVALAALTALIFLMSGSTGGLFTHKLTLISYFENANGLKVGAPVTLDGVTIGNVTSIKIVAHHEPAAVEVISKVGSDYLQSLHTDSTAAIDQAGVLGDSYLEISSAHATGPVLADGATLKVTTTPGIQDVIKTSQDSIAEITKVINKVGLLMDTINSGKGTVGMLLNDPATAQKIVRTIDQLQSLSAAISTGKGSLGKLVMDDELYTKANSTIDKLNHIVGEIDSGQGTAGKLIKDDSLYKNLNAAIANTNTLLEGVNAGKGSLGKLAKDPAFAAKLEDTVTNLNTLLKNVDEGRGTLGQLAANRSLYDNLDKTIEQTGELMTAFRTDPRKYLNVKVKIF